MSPRASLAAVCLAVVGSLACSGPGGDSPPAPERRFLSVGTAPPGGAFFVIGGAVAEVLSESAPDWQVTAEATKGTQENIRRLVAGELDLALANSAITYFAVRGEGWERAFEVRALMTLVPNVGMFLTREDSGIDGLSDLRGQRVAVGPAGAGFEFFLKPILAAHGVAWEELTPLSATQESAVDLLSDGSAAAVFLGGAVPTASITQAMSGGGVRFVPYDPGALDELARDYPFFQRVTLPAGTYRGQDADFAALDVGSLHLVVASACDEELAHRMTKSLWEHRDRFAEMHPVGRALRPEVVVRDTGTPFHPGAERFYREIGIWPN